MLFRNLSLVDNFISFLLLTSIFPVPSPSSKSQLRGLSMVVKGMQCGHPSNTYERTAVLNVPSSHTPLSGQLRPFQCSSSWAPDQIPGQPLCRKLFKRLINLLGMSQERWAISLEKKYIYDGCVWLYLYACVCVLICVHFTSIKTQPWLLGSCVVNILGSKQVTSELLKLVS